MKEDPIPRIQGLTGGAGADAVFEVIGETGAQARALWSTGVAGKLVLVGAYYGLQLVDFSECGFFKYG